MSSLRSPPLSAADLRRHLPLLALAVAPFGPPLLAAWGRRQRAGGVWDVIVVPGARVDDQGVPMGAFRRRLDAAEAAFQAGLAPRVAVSGAGEAEVGAVWLQTRGMPAAAIVTETEARTTEENAALLARILGPVRVLVVSCDVHLWRCGRTFRRHFPEVGLLGVPSPGIPWRNGARELFGVARDLLR